MPKEYVMEQGAVFQSNRSQAIPLPKAVALPDDVKRVDVIAVGRTRIIASAGEAWDSWFEVAAATPDFMSERDQPAVQEREASDAQVHVGHQHLRFYH
jgi:antitoxin VapB